MPVKGSNRATAPSLTGWAGALSHSTSTGWSGWPTTPIPGAADAVARLRATGEPVVFVTNNSSQPLAAVGGEAGRHGIPADGDVVTSAHGRRVAGRTR